MKVNKFYSQVYSNTRPKSQIKHCQEILDCRGRWVAEGNQLGSFPKMAEYLTIVRNKRFDSSRAYIYASE